MMSREASIGIDGVYYNPAGVVFLGDGHHLSINWQLAYQDRTIKNDYSLFTNNVNNPITPREFKGEAFAPVIPSFQYAYNKGRWSFQGNFALTGGGGKCTFDNGLGSFERIVAETAMAACGLARTVDGALGSVLGREVSMFGSDQAFGAGGKYSFNSYMHGRQYYFGLSLGAAYKVSDNFSVFGGVRGIYATTNYYGYVEDIKVGNMPLYMVLDPTKKDAANIELSCDQSGIGFTPIIGVDFKTGKWNFSAKYEFKTRMRLKNKSANSLSAEGIPMLSKFKDGNEVAEDTPGLLTVGAQYSLLPSLRISAGWHHYFDVDTKQYTKDMLSDTNEYLVGAEYDINKCWQVSAGAQKTQYGFKDAGMNDISFNVNSYSIGFGVGVQVSEKVKINAAYFQTIYSDYDKKEAGSQGTVTNSFTRTNRVIGLGVDLTL